MNIINILNKIKWDKRENPDDYTIFYLDRISNQLKPLKYTDIIRVEDSFMIVIKENEETHIPLHRIKRIRKKDKIILER